LNLWQIELLNAEGEKQAGTSPEQFLADFHAGPMEVPADSRFGHIHNISDIVNLTSLDIPQKKCRTLLTGKPFSGLGNMFTETDFPVIVFGVVPMIFECIADVFYRFVPVPAVFAHMIDGGIHRYAV
jgi:hypothetical protein